MTYIWTGKCWAYLAVVLDLFSHKPVGRAMLFFPDSALTGKALSMAWGKPANLLYCSPLNQQKLQTVTVTASDKAKPESQGELPG